MKKNKKWFSIIVAMWLVLITSLLAFTILEFIIPFSKDIKWIENSAKSYYQANTWIERWLYFFSNRLDSNWRNEFSKSYSGNYDYKFSTFSSGTTLPLPWKWNSKTNHNFDIISITEPIQLSVGYWFITNLGLLSIEFNVPDLNNDSIISQLDWTSIINWQLLSPNDTLNATTADIFTSSDINDSWSISLQSLMWKKVSDSSNVTFWTFYTANCLSDKCILKFSVINELKTTDTPSISIPYLEWKLNSWTNILPLRYSIIESSWKSFWFTKSLNIRVPQETVSQAFDFTVFQ